MCDANVLLVESLKESVNDKVAAENIRKFLQSLKSSGRKTVNVLDLLLEFRYPPEQIERAMSLLEKEGIVKEDWPPW